MAEASTSAREAEAAHPGGRTMVLVLAAIAYLPALLTRPGYLAADTKAYLFVDPGRLLERAAFLWDPNMAAGTVTHQNIGYLFPLGPLFWVVDRLPMPMWVGQRMWIGTILFAAGYGIVKLGRSLGLNGWALLAGAFMYQLSPYTLAYLGRTTVLLMPWAALPWLIYLARRALLERTWRAPAWFALVVTVVGGVNASSLLFIGLGPVLWFPHAVWVSREANWRDSIGTMARIGLLLIPTQLWWVAGLSIQGAYGLPILELTETVKTIAETSTAAEIIRHLGYWYFYGVDGLEPWTLSSRFYTQVPALIVVSFALPALAMGAAVVVRWRHRSYAVSLVIIGLLLGVGTHPYDSPAPVAGLIKASADASTAGMAMRNSPRAVPLLVLGSTLLVTALLSALVPALRSLGSRRLQLLADGAVAGVAVIAVLNMAPMWTGGIVADNLEYPEDLPDHWDDVAAALDERDDGTRVIELPGMDFGSYRWGETQDVVTPGLIDRPWVGRQLTAYGTPATVDLIRAFDRRFQEGTLETEAIAPISALLGAGDVLLVSEQQYERYRLPRPRWLWEQMVVGVDGLGEPVAFGEPSPNVPSPRQPMLDEIELALDPTVADPAPLTLFALTGAPRPEVRTASRLDAVIAGDGDGVVDLAAAGLLPDGAFAFAGTFAQEPERIAAAAAAGSRLIITDTNRQRGQRWGTLRENNGFTEQDGEVPLVDDPSDARLELFPGAGGESFTTTDLRGIRSVRASTYGNPVSFTAEERPALAVDGDLRTAWQVGAFDEVRGERIEVQLEGPVTTGSIRVVQSQSGVNRWITEVRVTIDGDDIGVVPLDDSSRAPTGQEIDLGGERQVQTVELEIVDVDVPRLHDYRGMSGVGFAEIDVAGSTADEIIVMPSDLLSAAGGAAATAPIDVVLTRVRANPAEPFRSDPELGMSRTFDLPSPRAFALEGTARLNSNASGELLDMLLGRGTSASEVTVRTSDHLSGSIAHRGSAALDGDPATMWSPGFTDQVGRWIEVEVPEPVTVARLDMLIVADGRRSVPTRLALTVDGVSTEVEVPVVEALTEENATVPVRVELDAPLTGSTIRVQVIAVDERTTPDYYNPTSPVVTPIAIAELGIDGVSVPPLPQRFPETCMVHLLTIDGTPVAVRLVGTTDDAVAGEALQVERCDDGDLELEGSTEVHATAGVDSGIDVDRLVLRSAGVGMPAPVRAAPAVEVVSAERTGRELVVSDVDGPFWLILGQSQSDGWTATADELGDLGPSVVIDGFANGWFVDAPAGTGTLAITLDWAPQRRVWLAIAVSVVGLLGCAVLLAWPRRAELPSTRPSPAVLSDPSRAGGTRPHPVGLGLTVLGIVVGATLVAGPWAGLVLGVLTLAALLVDRGRLALALPAVLTVPAVAVWVAAVQWRYDTPIGVEWPVVHDPAKWFVLVAVLALGADLVAGWLRRRRRSPGVPPL